MFSLLIPLEKHDRSLKCSMRDTHPYWQKPRYSEGGNINKLGAEAVVAFGNGSNDRRMLKAARIGIAVSQGEGRAVDALVSADVFVTSAKDGFHLLLNPKRCMATLGYLKYFK